VRAAAFDKAHLFERRRMAHQRVLPMANVEFQRVSKNYGDLRVLEPLDLVVREGEFLTLLGPSGCGKTTTLRLIAGFIEPTEGRVLIGAQDVTNLPPQKREIGMVFQDYALFPHLTIAENIGFGLVERRMKRRDIEARVQELLNLIRLPGIENRFPSEVSGGQQQRIAVARAVAHPPKVLLMDEPLGALDLKLREVMQIELRRIQQALGITTVYVTHDQTEAMTMSDRIVVMNKGRIEQLGTARDIYRRPETRFVADFVGKINLLRGTCAGNEGADVLISVGSDTFRAPAASEATPGESIWLGVRPESLRLLRDPDVSSSGNTRRGKVKTRVFVGNQWNFVVDFGESVEWIVEVRDGADELDDGALVAVSWPKDAGVVLYQ
jgi:spermidine/putrescine ABC transporter ATP-binding subunit